MKKNGTAQQLKSERQLRGMSRSDADRERQQAAKQRPPFWWVEERPNTVVTSLYNKVVSKLAARAAQMAARGPRK